MTNPNLASYADRCRVLETVARGAPIVNRLIGTAIKFEPNRGLEENLKSNELADPDRYYTSMMAALFGQKFDIPQDFDRLFACYALLTGVGGLFDSWMIHGARCRSADENKIIDAARQGFIIQPIDLFDALGRQNFVSLKLNHFQWEYNAWLARSAASQPLIREQAADMSVLRSLHDTRFDDLLVLALRRLETEPGCLSGPGHALGLGISNGDTTFEEDLARPLHPVPHNALFGLLVFFDGFSPGVTVHAADSAAIKNVFWSGGLERLVRLAADAADAVVFIVPPHLAGIALPPPAPQQEVILVPGVYVQELWPAVMAGVAGQFSEILDRHRRVAVFMQASAMSVPIGALIHQLLGEHPDHGVHCIDFGQVLDVAVYPSQTAGPWIRKPEVAAAIAGQRIPFVMTAP